MSATSPPAAISHRTLTLAVLVAALGYFVDIFDLILFGVVRIPSLRDLGVLDFAGVGEMLQNCQLIGLVLGGVLWGVIGDKLGRRAGLFASIVVYSTANLANAYVQSVEAYAVLRFIAGIGLAGELGAGITLVSELMKRTGRGWGTTIVAATGILGGVTASQVGRLLDWRDAYLLGGALGILLLLLRIGVVESTMFTGMGSEVPRGRFLALLHSRERRRRYLAVIGVAIPIWYCVGILIYFSREIGGAMGMLQRPEPATALLYCYSGLAVGDVASGLLSQYLRSRRRALKWFLTMTLVAILAYFTLGRISLGAFYVVCAAVGFATGYWAVFVTTAAELFGTNLRATAATTAPNFVRAAVFPMTLAYGGLHQWLGWDRAQGYAAIGVVCLVVAALALRALPETYGRDLEFVET